VKVVKLGVLAFLIVQTLFLDLFPIAEDPTAVRIVGTVLYLVGLGTAITSRLQLGKNWVDLEDSQVLPAQCLITTGIYRYVRHPIYAGDVLLLVGLELALNSWLVLAVLAPTLVVVRQAGAEEAVLAQAFPGYEAYRAGTKRFIPFLV
jgi:protein-S-isoprenylcysteine O-methyltransferase Ste14